MNIRDQRQIFKSRIRSKYEVQDLLSFVFAGELIAPSPELFIVSPWISDISIFDNRFATFSTMESTWSRRHIRLAEVLTLLLARSTRVSIKTLADGSSEEFVRGLEGEADRLGLSHRLRVRRSSDLHTKGLLTDEVFISGSMNFTYMGVEIREEAVTLNVGNDAVRSAALTLKHDWEQEG